MKTDLERIVQAFNEGKIQEFVFTHEQLKEAPKGIFDGPEFEGYFVKVIGTNLMRMYKKGVINNV